MMESLSYRAACCGTLGELYQGPLFRNNDVEISIISALSNNSTRARFLPGAECNLLELGKFKVKKSLSIFFEKIAGREITGSWAFDSDIVIGAGMSSSTSDIISALRCASHALGINLTLDDITTCLAGVERSDSVFIDVPCLYLSQQQKIIDIYRPHGRIYCIYGLEGRGVDTSRTRDTLIAYYNDERRRYQALSDDVRQAFSSADRFKIIACSTASAVLSQGIFPKNGFEAFSRQMSDQGADGLIVAHTGALLGYLYASPPDQETISFVSEFIRDNGLRPCYGEIF